MGKVAVEGVLRSVEVLGPGRAVVKIGGPGSAPITVAIAVPLDGDFAILPGRVVRVTVENVEEE